MIEEESRNYLLLLVTGWRAGLDNGWMELWMEEWMEEWMDGIDTCIFLGG